MNKNYTCISLLLALLLVGWLPARAQTEAEQQATALALQTCAQWAAPGLRATDLRITRAYAEPSGLFYTYAQQLHDGIPVYNQVVTLVYKEGRLRHHAGHFVPARPFAGLAAAPSVSAAAAVARALASLPGAAGQQAEPLDAPSGPDRQQRFAPAGVARRPIVARLVWAVDEQQQPRLAWNVNVDVLASADWLNIRVDARTGKLLDQDNWTVHEAAAHPAARPAARAHAQPQAVARPVAGPRLRPAGPLRTQAVTPASYTVAAFPRERPDATGLQTETNPWQKAGAGNAATTHGWHFDGTTNYTDTRGNNVWAYDDSLKQNKPGRFAASTGTGSSLAFGYVADFTQAPTLGKNRRAATVNLFYWNNLLHDVLYQYGLTEAAGNFQADNLGRGGAGGDYVKAEAQDGNGTNNANFNTPPDGFNGRMQMYLYNAFVPPYSVNVTAPAAVAGSYAAVEGKLSINNKLSSLGPISGQLVLYTDAGSNPTTSLACAGYGGSTPLTGKIAVLYRGNCTFITKIKNAQLAGAKAVIVINNAPSAITTMSDSDDSIVIPAVMVSQADGATLAGQLANGVQVTLPKAAPADPQLDSDYDNGIVAHEYGHGLSNRLTGGGTNTSCLYNAEQAGEGWSDYIGLMMTTDWGTAQLTDGPKPRGHAAYTSGLSGVGATTRRYPYSTSLSVNPLTYANMATSTEVHDIGEIWCATLWDMTWNIIQQQARIEPNLYNSASTGGNAVALSLVVQGLKLQPCKPGFLDSRDAILAADSLLYGGRYHCTIWGAFARRGMGFSAREGSSSSATDQTAAYDMPTATLRKNTTPVTSSQFDIAITATCDCPASQLTITDQLPADLQYLGSTGGTLGANNTVSFANQSFATGQQRVYRIQAQTAAGKGCAVTLPVNDDRDANTAGGLTPAMVSGSDPWTPSTARAHGGSTSWKMTDPVVPANSTLTSAAFTPSGFLLLSFYHYYDTEGVLDGGMVAISTDNGVSWQDAAPYFIQNGYNSKFASGASAGKPCFSGKSSILAGPAAFQQTILNLSAFSGQPIQIRFQFQSDTGNDRFYEGWYLDDIKVQNGCGGVQQVQLLSNNTVTASYSQPTFLLAPAPPTIAGFSPNPGTAGQAVTVTGTNLFNLSGLTVNGAAVPAAAIVNSTSTSATFRVPATAAASGTTSFSTPLGTASSTALAVGTALPPGNALAFDGTDDYVSLPLLVHDDFTIELWVHTTQAGGTGTQWWQGSGLVDGEVGGNDNDLGLTLLGGKAAFGLGNPSGTDLTITSTTSINDGRWHHLAATRQGGTVQLYVDGQLEAASTAAGTAARTSPGLRLGSILSGPSSGFFNGRLDDLRFYSTVLTQANIRADMQSPASAVPASLTAYFNFDQGTPGGLNTGQTTLFDQTASAYAGTVANADLSGTASNWVASYALVTPTATAATGVGTTSFTATWAAPAVGTADSYLLDVATNGTFTAPVSGSPFAVAGGTLSRTLTGLSANTAYYYRVRAEKAGLAPQGQGSPSATIAVATRCVATATTQNVSATLAASGTATVTAAQLNNGSSSPCGPLAVGAQKVMTAVVAEGGTLTLTAPAGQVFTAITFASYGTPTRNANGTYTASSCHAPGSQAVAEAAFLNKNTGSIAVTNTTFSPDPCPNVAKQLVVQAVYGTPQPQLSYTCAETGSNLVLLTATAGTGVGTAVATATVSVPVQASTTWSGAISTDWNDCRNWENGVLPSATVSVVLPAGQGSYPSLPANAIARVASLTIGSGATLTLAASALLLVSGDFINNGTDDLGGSLLFTGTAAQTLNSATRLAIVQVTKASGTVTLAHDLAISTALRLTSGTLQTTPAHQVVLGSAATLTEFETSYVTGRVATTRPLTAGNAEGFGGLGLVLQPATGSVAPGSTLVARTTGTAIVGASGSKSILRAFDIQPTTNAGLNVAMDFSYFTHELNGIPVASLLLFKSTTGTAPWLPQRGTTAGTNVVSKTGITDFSVWTLGNADAPLPVQLTTFTAVLDGPAAVRLDWGTASERNSLAFDVERSLDGTTFARLGTVPAAGTSSTAHSYRWLDASLPPSATVLYYRLKQVDIDGTTTYSPVRSVARAKPTDLSLFPNPTTGTATLTGAVPGALVQVFDALGRAVATGTADAGGAATLHLPHGLAAGVYVVRTGSAALRLLVE